MIACNQVGAIKTKLPSQQLRRTTLISLSSLQQVIEGLLSDYALETQPTAAHVSLLRESRHPYHHRWFTCDGSGHCFCCGIGSYRGPYRIRYGTFKTGQGGIGFLLSPGLCSNSSAFGSSAKATTDMLCCKGVGFLGVRITIPGYNTVQQLGLFLGKASLRTAMSPSPCRVAAAWECLMGSGAVFLLRRLY